MIPLLFGLYWAAVNRWAGTDALGKFAGPLAFPLVVYFAGGGSRVLAYGAAVVTISFILWRHVGWFKSIDMGKDAGSFSRDYWMLTAICGVLAAPPVFLMPSSVGPEVWGWFAASLIAPPVCYTLVMRGLPNEPKYRHIAVAESLTGFCIGIAAYYLVTGMPKPW